MPGQWAGHRHRHALAWLLTLCVALVTVLLSVSAAHAENRTNPVLTAARIAGDSAQTRFVADLTYAVGFNVYVLPRPYRLIIDLPEIDFNLPPNSGRQSMGLVREYRYGKIGKGRARIIMDLAGPVLIRKSFVLHASDRQPARLVVDLVQTSPEKFGKIHEIEQPKFHKALKQAARNERVLTGKDADETPVETPPLSIGYLAKQSVDEDPQTIIKKKSGDPVVEPAAFNPKVRKLARIPLPRPKPVFNKDGAEEVRKPIAEKPAQRDKNGKYVIVIDPGHGGQDPGAIVRRKKITEKAVALAFAKVLRTTLGKNSSYSVHLTRETDVFLTLKDRVSKARELNADLFISIHADALKNRRVRGGTVYTLSETASDEEAAELAHKENRADIINGVDLGAESEYITNILIDLAQRETKNHSTYFARKMVAQLKPIIRMNKRPHRSAGFRVLKAPDVPSILLELGFLSNRHDVALLTSKAWRAKTAKAVSKAIERYFSTQLAARR